MPKKPSLKPFLAAASGWILTLLVTGCQIEPVPVLHAGLKPDLFTRYTMRAAQSGPYSVLYRSNYLGHHPLFPPGSKTKITLYSEVRIDMVINGIKCRMFFKDHAFPTDPSGIDAFLEKYFAKSVAELDLDSLESDVLDQIKRGNAAIGMTKEQVLMAVGYPSHIDVEKVPADSFERARILESNHWTYRVTEIMLIPTWRTYVFDGDGKLYQVIQ